ncbi:MAG: hypothetical protein AAB919_01360 [Patescibacteria group bacterium]
MSLATLVGKLIGLVNTIIPVLAALAMVIFFIGLIRYIYQSADAHGHAEGRQLIMWGLIALFILVSVWGILGLMSQALNL